MALLCHVLEEIQSLWSPLRYKTLALGMGGGHVKSKNEWHKAMYNKAFAEESIGSRQFIEMAKKQVAFLVKVTNLKQGDSVLDVPCGVGRHSLEFAKHGAKVVGIDISNDCLKIARHKFKHKNVHYLHGDMQNLRKFQGRFDLVVNLFTSFGYFSTDEENFKVLKSMVNCLTPGGKIVVNLIDRDWILSIFDPARWSEVDGRVILEASRYDKKSKYNESQVFIVNNKFSPPKLEHYHYHRVRLYSKAELVDLMKKAGLTNIKVYGDYDGGPYKKGKSTHPIYVGTKK
jgi:ubiquinone/menaquinone biosynthesis C-methylase UbiE